MRTVNCNIPDIQDVVDVIPCNEGEKNKLKEYLEIIDEEYREKIVENLYLLNLDECLESESEPFDAEKLKQWYNKLYTSFF